MSSPYPAVRVTVVDSGPPRVLAMDSIAYLDSTHAGAIVCCGSHGGLSAAQFAARFPVGAVVFNDAGFGKDAAGVKGLELLATRGVPAAAVDNTSARIGEGVDVWENGRFSAVNSPAEMLGWRVGQTVREAVSQIGDGRAGSKRGPLASGGERDRSSATDPSKFKSKREFSHKVRTSIWKEEPAPTNAFFPRRSLCHGYDFFGELLGSRPFTHVVYLLMRGELPGGLEARTLDLLMTSVINPGPRHWAVRAAMNGAVGGTSIGNCLVAGLGTLQGEYLGAQCVREAAEMFLWAREQAADPAQTSTVFASRWPELPGYGLLYSERDSRAARVAELLESMELAGPVLNLARAAEQSIAAEHRIWLTLPGVFAAALLDLGFSEDQAAGLFLIASAPGILAHAAEQRNRRWNEYPIYWDPKLYSYEGFMPPGTEEESS